MLVGRCPQGSRNIGNWSWGKRMEVARSACYVICNELFVSGPSNIRAIVALRTYELYCKHFKLSGSENSKGLHTKIVYVDASAA